MVATPAATILVLLPLACAAEAEQQRALVASCLEPDLGVHFLQRAFEGRLAALKARGAAVVPVTAPATALAELPPMAETTAPRLALVSIRGPSGSLLLPIAVALLCAVSALACIGYKVKACQDSPVDAVGLLFLPVQFTSLFHFSAPIIDSYDLAIALGKSTSDSGLLLGVFFLGSFCGAACIYLVMSAWTAAWQDGLLAILRLGLACQVLGAATYFSIAFYVDHGHVSNGLWHLLIGARMLGGMGAGMLIQFNYTSVPHLARLEDRPTWMVNILCANMLGIGFGPLATAVAQCLGPQPAGAAMGSVVNLVMCTSTFVAVNLLTPTLTDANDLVDGPVEERGGPKLAGVRRSQIMIIIGCLLMSFSRAFVVGGLEASSVILLETVFHWDKRVIGVAVPATFLACIPLRLFYSRHESMLRMSNWIRVLSLSGILGGLLLFDWPCRLLQHCGLTAAWPCGAVLIFADMLLFPTLFLGNGLSTGLMQQYLLPRGSLLDANRRLRPPPPADDRDLQPFCLHCHGPCSRPQMASDGQHAMQTCTIEAPPPVAGDHSADEVERVNSAMSLGGIRATFSHTSSGDELQQSDKKLDSCEGMNCLTQEMVTTMLAQISTEMREVFAEQCCTLCSNVLSSIRAELSLQQVKMDELKQCLSSKEVVATGACSECSIEHLNEPTEHATRSAFPKCTHASTAGAQSGTSSAILGDAVQVNTQRHEGRKKLSRSRELAILKSMGGTEAHEGPVTDVEKLKSYLDEQILKDLALSNTDRPDAPPAHARRQAKVAEAGEERDSGQESGHEAAAREAGDTGPCVVLPGRAAASPQNVFSIKGRANRSTSSLPPGNSSELLEHEKAASEHPNWSTRQTDRSHSQSLEDLKVSEATSEQVRGSQSCGKVAMATLRRMISIGLSSMEPNRVEELRTKRNCELLATLGGNGGLIRSSSASSVDMVSTSALPLPLLVLNLLGVVPFAKGRRCAALWYQRSVFMLMVLACCAIVLRIGNADDASVVLDNSGSRDYYAHLGLLSDLPLALGAIVGLLALKVPMGSSALCNAYQLLATCAKKEGFSDKWARRARQDLFISVVVWLCTVFERLRGSGALAAAAAGHLQTLDVLHILAFMAVSAVVMSLVLCVLWISVGLAISVDMFCTKVCDRADLALAVQGWNVLQAMLRKTCKSVEHCFFVLQTMAFAMVVTAVADSNRSPPLLILPGAFITLGIGRIFWQAAGVTAKCDHVPSLINSLWFGKFWDDSRLYAVHYITYSGAAFYVYGVTINFTLAIKIVYVVGLVASQLVQRYFVA